MGVQDNNFPQNISSDDLEERRPRRDDPYGTLDVVDPDQEDPTGEWDDSPETTGSGDPGDADRPEIGVPIGTSGVGGGAPGSQIFVPEF